MRLRLHRLTLVLGLAVGLAACTSAGGSAGGQPSGVGRISVPRVVDRLSVAIQLSAVQAVGGQPIAGALVVSNPGNAIDLGPGGCRPRWTVVLASPSFPPNVPWEAVCSIGPFVMAHGTTRLPFSLPTTYPGCQMPSGSGGALPRCLASGPPPLPQGNYTAVLERSRTVALPPAPPVAVTVLAS